MDDFTAGYVECALRASTAPEDNPLDREYGPEDVANLDDVRTECAAFQDANRADLDLYESEWDASHAGHDFFLTRNGHGTGFWDRHYAPGPLRDALLRLTDAAKAYGSDDPYVGDDGRVYFGS